MPGNYRSEPANQNIARIVVRTASFLISASRTTFRMLPSVNRIAGAVGFDRSDVKLIRESKSNLRYLTSKSGIENTR